MSCPYPYATPETDGYHLELVEFDESQQHSHLRYPVPADEHRFGITKVEHVKLIFVYEKSHMLNGQSFSAEHMWGEYLENGDGCMLGRLDNEPQHTDLIHCDDVLAFHPKHIVRIWRYDPDEGTKRCTAAIPPKE